MAASEARGTKIGPVVTKIVSGKEAARVVCVADSLEAPMKGIFQAMAAHAGMPLKWRRRFFFFFFFFFFFPGKVIVETFPVVVACSRRDRNSGGGGARIVARSVHRGGGGRRRWLEDLGSPLASTPRPAHDASWRDGGGRGAINAAAQVSFHGNDGADAEWAWVLTNQRSGSREHGVSVGADEPAVVAPKLTGMASPTHAKPPHHTRVEKCRSPHRGRWRALRPCRRPDRA